MFDKVVIYAPKSQQRLLRKEIQKNSFRLHDPGNDFNFFKKIKRKIFRTPHTHTYIFEGFYNAADFLGYANFWIENQSDLEEIADSKTLVFCEGSYLPDFKKELNCKFVLHSIPANLGTFSELSESKNCLNLEVFKNEALNFDKIGDLTYFDQENFTLYQPWATNLLPNEILMGEDIPNSKNRISYYIGMLYEEGVERAREYNSLLKDSIIGTKIKCVTGASHKTCQKLTMKSSICLDIRYDHHIEIGYIPCRIFKTLSYGRQIYVNSHYIKKYLSHIPFVKFFNDGKCLRDQYNESLSNKNFQNKEIIEKRDFSLNFIKNHHTYVNRLKNVISVFN